MTSSGQGKRRELDLMKLMRSSHAVEMIDEEKSAITGRIACRVRFHGPTGSCYEGGVWYVNVDLPVDYPYKSPSIGFNNHIYHPNIDFRSGSVCLDVINQTWSPMYDLVNIFDVFLPQLLTYPNPADPLNGEAASLLLRDEKKYQSKVKELVKLHASPSEKDNEFGVKIRSKKSTPPAAISTASSAPSTNSIGINTGALSSSFNASSLSSPMASAMMMTMGSPSNGLSPFATTSVGSLNSHSNITMFANGIGAAGDLTRQSSVGSTFSATSSSSNSLKLASSSSANSGLNGNGNNHHSASKDHDMHSVGSHGGEEEEDLAADMEL